MEKVSLSNKVFTDNPLLDEIVYNARQIATGIVVKDYDLANKNETKESMLNGDTLVAIGNNTISFSNFYYDEEILEHLYSKETAAAFARDNNLIPKADRQKLLNLAIQIFKDNYEEQNNYYRMLHGQPNYDETGAWKGLWIDTKYINSVTPTSIDHVSAFYKEEYDYDDDGNRIVVSDYQPIDQLSVSQKNLIYENGTCENIYNDTNTLASWDLTQFDVRYIMHIGDREVDYYNARVADRFALLYCPESDAQEVQRRFKDLFEANRLYLLYTGYSEAYKYRSDYYDNFMMIFLTIQTIIDLIVELPEYIIRRDIFDTRTCKYIFESNGVKYFKDIPLKYQVALVKNLNKLIKFKSTDKCIVDIVSIFGAENIEVFRYYIMKDRYVNSKDILDYYDEKKVTTDSMGNTTVSEDNDKDYDLKFIKVPLLDKYDNYIRKDSSVLKYDTVVESDAYWTGDKQYKDVKQDIKDIDFTVLRSKYYSIEAVIDLAKRNFTLGYFMNILMYNNVDKSALMINLPNVSTTKKFELVDTIIALFSLSYIYYGVEDTIVDTRSKCAQILGFNMEADLAKISAWLEENHKGLTLKDLHVETYAVPDNNSIISFNQLQDIFFTNKDCYDHIIKVMRNPPSKEIYDAYRYLYKTLLIMNYNMEYFLVGNNTIVDQYKANGYKSKFIVLPKEEDYHNPDDFTRDWKWLVKSVDDNNLCFVVPDTFSEDHNLDLYIKENNDLKKIGTAKMAYTYREFLRYKDGSLFSFITRILNMNSKDTRQEACVNAIQAIVSYMKDYIDQDKINLDTVFAGLPSISIDFIKQYVTEVIDFFKSFKIFTHDSSIIYSIDDKFENYVQLIDHILLKYLFDKSEIIKIEDAIQGMTTGLTAKEKCRMIDKVWFDITTWLTKNYSEYYNSDNYKQVEKIIRDYKEHYTTLTMNSEEFNAENHYIKEIDDYAVDAIVHMLIDLVYEEHVNILESIHTEYNNTYDDYYRDDWLVDIGILLISRYLEDRMRYQDDITRSDFYDFYSVLLMNDARQSMNHSQSKSERYNLIDDYYSINTQEFPAHQFDT